MLLPTTISSWFFRSTVMFNGGRALGPWGVMHPTVCFLLGTFFVTNLFLAMLVDSFLHGGVDHEVDGVHGKKILISLNMVHGKIRLF